MARNRRCPHQVWEPACAICKPIQTHKDQAYHGTYAFSPKDRVEVHGKGHFTQECAKRGLVPVSFSDLTKNGEPYKPAPKSVAPAQLEAAVRYAKQTTTPERVERKWKQLNRRPHERP